MGKNKRHIICEKDVGLFSLIQQVISQIPFALSNETYPIVLFGDRCCYWTINGFAEKNNVWEYYFEPIIKDLNVNTLSSELINYIVHYPPNFKSKGYFYDNDTFVSNNFGNHKDFKGQSIKIPYKWKDPDVIIRNEAHKIIQKYIHPRAYIIDKVDSFFARYMQNQLVIGVHVRATDVSDLKTEYNLYRRYSYNPKSYIHAIENILKSTPDVKFFVATDSKNALDLLLDKFPNQVISYSSIFHTSDEITGSGAMGWKMPGYLTLDSLKAAKNGEEAIIDYLLLSKCTYLIHNGSSLARTVLLNKPQMPHQNLHSMKKYLYKVFDPSSLEIFYLTKISLQKGLWEFNRMIKMLADRIFKKNKSL